MTFASILVGLAMTAAGVGMVKYTFQMTNFTGRQEWIEKYAGSGSTYSVYKLFGVALVIVGILVATGFGNDVMNFFFAPFLNTLRPLVQQKTGN